MLCKNDARDARRASPSWGKSPSLVEIVLREAKKFPLAVPAVKRTKQDLSQTGISPEGLSGPHIWEHHSGASGL
jgi:hypothetical protein